MLRHAIIAAIALSLCIATATAQETTAAQGTATVSLSCSDMEVTDLLAKLSQEAKVAIVTDGAVKGKLTMNLNNVTVEQALSTVGKIAKLEWVKVHTAPASEGESIDAGKLFTLVNALKAFDNTPPVMWGEPDSGSWGLFVPPVKEGSGKVPSVAEQLGMKPVYLVRVEQAAPAANVETASAVAPTQPLAVPPADTQLAAQSLWAHFSQVPVEQRAQVMRELGRMMYDNLTPDQRDQMRRSFDGRRTRGDGTEGNFRFERRTRTESETRTNRQP